MIYRLLGELEISRDDRSLDLPGGHTLIVLAALLINANQRVSKAELLQAAWGSEEVSEAQLHKSAAALRALLGPLGRAGDLVTHARYGYEFRVADDDVDMLSFRRLARQAEEARSHRRPDDEISCLRRALGLWRGQHPLSNVPGGAFRQEIDRLEQRRKRAAVRLFDLEIARRGYDRILDDLALIAGYYPGDGRLGEQLMIVQYRCGHVTDATAAYERHAAALGEQTGGEPDPALRALYYAIASGAEPTVAAAESVIARRAGLPDGPGPGPVIPRQLPPDAADLVGRDDLVAEASWLLGRQPGTTIPGRQRNSPTGWPGRGRRRLPTESSAWRAPSAPDSTGSATTRDGCSWNSACCSCPASGCGRPPLSAAGRARTPPRYWPSCRPGT